MLFSSFFGFCICSLLALLAICLAHRVLHFHCSKYIHLSLNLSIALAASHNFDLLYLIIWLKCLIFNIVSFTHGLLRMYCLIDMPWFSCYLSVIGFYLTLLYSEVSIWGLLTLALWTAYSLLDKHFFYIWKEFNIQQLLSVLFCVC